MRTKEHWEKGIGDRKTGRMLLRIPHAQHHQLGNCILHGAGAEVWSICVCTTVYHQTGVRVLYILTTVDSIDHSTSIRTTSDRQPHLQLGDAKLRDVGFSFISVQRCILSHISKKIGIRLEGLLTFNYGGPLPMRPDYIYDSPACTNEDLHMPLHRMSAPILFRIRHLRRLSHLRHSGRQSGSVQADHVE